MGSRWLARHAISDRVNGALRGARVQGRACAARMPGPAVEVALRLIFEAQLIYILVCKNAGTGTPLFMKKPVGTKLDSWGFWSCDFLSLVKIS